MLWQWCLVNIIRILVLCFQNFDFALRIQSCIEETWMFLPLLAIKLLREINMVAGIIHVSGLVLFSGQQVPIMKRNGALWNVASGALA